MTAAIKRILLTAIIALTAIAASAQSGQDFSTRFMQLYSDSHPLNCKTISPSMMEKVMRLDNVEKDKTTQQVLSQLKSIRIVSAKEDADQLFSKAQTLAKQNRQRYRPYASGGGSDIYTRKRGKTIVELVVIMKKGGHFSLLNFTGNMSPGFIEKVRSI